VIPRPKRPKKHGKIRIRTILLVVNLIVLVMPVGGIYFLKVYESALVRQTESELIAQAAFVSALYKNALQTELSRYHESVESSGLGREVAHPPSDEGLHPILPSLDLAKDPVYPPRPNGYALKTLPNSLAVSAGQAITPVLKEAQRTTLSGIKVLDANGVAVGGQNEQGLYFGFLPEVKQALTGKPMSLLRERVLKETPPPIQSISRGSAVNVWVTMPIFMDRQVVGVVIVSRTPMDIAKSLYNRRWDIAVSTIVLILITLALVQLTSQTITRPLDALVDQAQQITSGKPLEGLPPQPPVTRELAILSDAFHRMARTIQARSDYIRHFALNVSHEFKTPLTALQGTIELLQDHYDTMPTEQRERFLNNLAQDTHRLKRLVSRLLELARADVLDPAGEPTAIFPLLEQMSRRFADRGLTVQVIPPATEPRQPASLMTPISADVLDTIFTNLLENSLHHGADTVTVQASVEPVPVDETAESPPDAQQLHLIIADNGRGISEANGAKLFTMFFTTQREQGGTGLGLAIIRSLLAAHRGTIRWVPPAEAPDTPGATFEITAPLCTMVAHSESPIAV
jgi:signal transduction histidine kinase